MVNYNKLNDLVNIAIEDLEKYVSNYEDGIKSNSTNDTLKVLKKLKKVAISQTKLETYLIQSIHDISVGAVKEYEGTSLESSILNIRRFFKENIEGFDGYSLLGMNFNKYF